MKTILVLCDHAYTSGGLARVAIAAAAGMRRRGHRVIFFAGTGPVDPALTTAGVEVVLLDQPNMLDDPKRGQAALRGLWNHVGAQRLSKTISSLPAGKTVVHLQGWAKVLSPSVIATVRHSGLPILNTLHDFFALCPNGAFFDYQAGKNCTCQPLSARCIVTHCDVRSLSHKIWRIARHSVLKATGGVINGVDLVCLSEHQQKIVSRYLPTDANIHRLANPIEVTRGRPAPVGTNDSFVFVGRLSREKGADLLATAAAQLGVPAIFAGAGQESERIRAILPTAELPGWLEPHEVARLMQSARALVFPSIWYETFGLSVYEALAHGVPAIVSDNSAGAEAILPGRNGLLFRSGDAADLARQMEKLLDPEVAASMGADAHSRYWSDPLTLDRHLDGLERIYDAVLRRDAAGTAKPP